VRADKAEQNRTQLPIKLFASWKQIITAATRTFTHNTQHTHTPAPAALRAARGEARRPPGTTRSEWLRAYSSGTRTQARYVASRQTSKVTAGLEQMEVKRGGLRLDQTQTPQHSLTGTVTVASARSLDCPWNGYSVSRSPGSRGRSHSRYTRPCCCTSRTQARTHQHVC
jgi:hypothetical protein